MSEANQESTKNNRDEEALSQTLRSLGFNEENISKGIKLCQENYGKNYDLNQLTDTILKLEDKLAEKLKPNDELVRDNSTLRSQLETLQNHVLTMQNLNKMDKKRNKEKYSLLVNDYREAEAEIDELEKQNLSLQKEITQEKATIEGLEATVDRLKNKLFKNEPLVTEYPKLKQKIETLMTQKSKLMKKLEIAKKRIEKCEIKMANANSSNEQKSNENSNENDIIIENDENNVISNNNNDSSQAQTPLFVDLKLFESEWNEIMNEISENNDKNKDNKAANIQDSMVLAIKMQEFINKMQAKKKEIQSNYDELMENITNFETIAVSSFDKFEKDENIKEKIVSFEKNWIKWDIRDTVQWFKYVILHSNGNGSDKDDNESDSESESESGTDTDCSSEDESDCNNEESKNEEMINDKNSKTSKNDKNGRNITNITNGDNNGDYGSLDFVKIESKLMKNKFRAKHYLPTMDKGTFKKFGFYNELHYRLLYKKTKQLIRKYPKNKSKNRKYYQREKSNSETQTTNGNNDNINSNSNSNNSDEMEGFTNVTSM